MMIELDFSPRGKVDKRLSLGVGGYAGVRIGSENILLGSDYEGDRIRISTNNNYNTHLFRYGLQGQVGIKSWKVTGRIDARTFFQENAFNEDVCRFCYSRVRVLERFSQERCSWGSVFNPPNAGTYAIIQTFGVYSPFLCA